MTQFKIGDVAQSKLSGMAMTVCGVQPDLIECKWFTLDQTLHGIRTSISKSSFCCVGSKRNSETPTQTLYLNFFCISALNSE